MKINRKRAMGFLIFFSVCCALIVISTSLAQRVKHEHREVLPSVPAKHGVNDSAVVASTAGDNVTDNATTETNYNEDTPVAVPNSGQIQGTVRDSNKKIIESGGLTCGDEIKQRLRAAFQETPTKEITEFDNKSGGASNTLPVNTKISAALPFATMGTVDPR
jgi:hypothetical protein